MGLFIVFEGGEGSGKSTQARMLKHQLARREISAVLTREPGGTPSGDRLRRWVKWSPGVTPQSEMLVILAARSQLVTEVIRPALKDDSVVVCDRYFYSTLAYQGYGRGMDLDFLGMLNDFVTGGLQPDLVVLLDLDPARGLERLKTGKDRFEREDGDFHRRVHDGYLKMAGDDPERWLVLDASLPRRDLKSLIWQRVEKLLAQG